MWLVRTLSSGELATDPHLFSLSFPHQLDQPCFTSESDLVGGHPHGLQSLEITAWGFTPS